MDCRNAQYADLAKAARETSRTTLQELYWDEDMQGFNGTKAGVSGWNS
jgi:hypothetical protein